MTTNASEAVTEDVEGQGTNLNATEPAAEDELQDLEVDAESGDAVKGGASVVGRGG